MYRDGRELGLSLPWKGAAFINIDRRSRRCCWPKVGATEGRRWEVSPIFVRQVLQCWLNCGQQSESSKLGTAVGLLFSYLCLICFSSPAPYPLITIIHVLPLIKTRLGWERLPVDWALYIINLPPACNDAPESRPATCPSLSHGQPQSQPRESGTLLAFFVLSTSLHLFFFGWTATSGCVQSHWKPLYSGSKSGVNPWQGWL